MEFEQLKTFFVVFLAVCGAIITITGAISGVVKLKELLGRKRKEEDLSVKETLEKHTNEISIIKTDLQQVKKDEKESKEVTVLICKGVKALMDNAITGNGIDNLKKTRKELDDYLIEKD